MKNMKPLILISNDDGYHAKGINQLIEMVADMGEVIVCAPESARSGYATAFSATEPLRLKPRKPRAGVQVWSCNGTPVDCVKLALSELCPRKPDLVIGGINHGDNASVNSHYSGTMGVTREGCMKYIPSVAFSLCDHSDDADFSQLTPYVRRIVDDVLRHRLPMGVCLNVNFPVVDEFKGVKVCRMEQRGGAHDAPQRLRVLLDGGPIYQRRAAGLRHRQLGLAAWLCGHNTHHHRCDRTRGHGRNDEEV